MSHEIESICQPTFEEVIKQFEDWRKTRKKRGPIPELLWEAALRLTEKYSIHEITKTLHLNYQKFKELVAQRKGMEKAHIGVTRAEFLELNVTRPHKNVECVIEIDRFRGSRMKMSLKGETECDLLEWAKVMWERHL